MILNHVRSIFSVESVRTKIIATLALVLVYKLLSLITVPGADVSVIKAILGENQGLAFFSALTGGWIQNFSIILMGLSPYINAMIIIQLLTVIVPRLEAIKKEGEAGQRKINKMTRWLTLPLAIVQSYGMILLLNTLGGTNQVIDTSSMSTMLFAMTMVTAGTIFLVWLGEYMTEKWIGNGISILISASVIAWVPGLIAQYFPITDAGFLESIKASFTGVSDSIGFTGISSGLSFLIITALTVLVIYIIVKFTEGYRKIPVIYTRTGREEKSYFPIKVNQAWMVPIIFAVSLITFPWIVGQIMNRAGSTPVGDFLVNNFNFSNPTWPYIGVYFLLVVLFAFFYVSITFNTEEVAESIQKRGWYIPGVRPGAETAEYLGKVSARLNLFGGSFLALIAVFPYIMQQFFDRQIDFLIAGAGLIIIVSVVLDIIRKIDSEMQMFDYTRFK